VSQLPTTVTRRLRLRPAGSRITGSNLLQTVVTILVAASLAAAALVASSATDSWQTSLRQDIAKSAGVIEDARYVYGVEAPLGLDLALADARAREGDDDDALTNREPVFQMRRAHRGRDHLIADDRYLLLNGGYDVPRRLADLRLEHPELVRVDPGRALEQGDDRRDLSRIIASLAIPLVLLYLMTEVILRARAHRREGKTERATEGDEVGLVPRPWSTPAASRLGVTVAFVAWLAVTLLPVAQLRLANRAERATSLAARYAVDSSTMIAAGGMYTAFQQNSRQRLLWLGMHATGRQMVALDSPDAGRRVRLTALAISEARTLDRARPIVATMTRAPAAKDGVDVAALRAIKARPRDADAVRIEQNEQAAVAEQAGRRGDRTNIALGLAALTLSLSALAATGVRTRLKAIDSVAAAVLASSLVAALSVVIA
jgi:hypothetical protein